MKSQFRLNKNVITGLALYSAFSACIAGQMGTSSLPDFRWSGPFVGGYIGGAWGHSGITTNVGSVTETSYLTSTANMNAVNQNGSVSFVPGAFVGGGQLGGNLIYNNLVYGLVLDYGSFDFNEVNSIANSEYPDQTASYSLQTSINTNWLYTVRGRIGLAPANVAWPFLIYGTAGLAVTELNVSNRFIDTDTLLGIGGGSSSNSKNGWTVGGGIEISLTQHLTMNTEYLYANFGSVTVNSSIFNSTGSFGIEYQSLVSPFVTSAKLYASIFRVGLNYKFNPSV